FRSRQVVPRSAPEAVRRFHAGLPGYQPTPLHLLPGWARQLGLGRVYLKDESPRFGLQAFKALGASWAMHRLQQEGRLAGLVSSATDGNHGRAVAWAARRLGLQARIFMTSHSSPRRIDAIRAEGAEVVLVEGTYDDAVRACAERSAREGWQVVADVGYEGYLTIPAWITEGYGTLFEEVDQQLRDRALPEPDVVIIQAGVGGLAAAVVQHYSARAVQPAVAVVEPVDADPLLESALTPDARPAPSRGGQHSIMACLNCGEVSLTAWPVLRRGVDVFFSIEDRYAEEAMRRLAVPQGGDPRIVAGESGAAGPGGLIALMTDDRLAGARQALALGPGVTVLVVSTEGAVDPDAFARIVGRNP
ncbi:MAG TPA: diaminopropionate ammonia-lyase, partial [Gemmatimonadales bacterium]